MNSQDTITQYYQQHHGELLNYVISRLQGATEAEDIVQDVFLRLISSQQLITTVTLPSLVYTMARHLICDYYRRRKPRKDYEYELQMADVNRQLASDIETVVLFSRPELANISSSILRELVHFGRDISEWLPEGLNYNSVM